jgi:hypothetical protein
MSAVPKIYLTPAEYLAFERQSDVKHEYFRGELFAIPRRSRLRDCVSGASRQHVRMSVNVTTFLILRQLEAEGNEKALAVLAAAAGNTRKKEHAVWEEEYQAKDVFSPDFLRQKVEYIHNNPCQPRWQLSAKPEEYVWSSAGFYLAGRRALIPLSDVRDFLA